MYAPVHTGCILLTQLVTIAWLLEAEGLMSNHDFNEE